MPSGKSMAIDLPLSAMPLTCCIDLDKLETFRGVAFGMPGTARNRPLASDARHTTLPFRRPPLRGSASATALHRRTARAKSASVLRPTQPHVQPMIASSAVTSSVALPVISRSSLEEHVTQPHEPSPAVGVRGVTRPQSAMPLYRTAASVAARAVEREWRPWQTMAPELYNRYRFVQHGKSRDTSAVLRSEFDAAAPQAVHADKSSDSKARLQHHQSSISLDGRRTEARLKRPSSSSRLLRTRGYYSGVGEGLISVPSLAAGIFHYSVQKEPRDDADYEHAKKLIARLNQPRRLGIHSAQMKSY